MPMPTISIMVGVLLLLQGVGFYLGTPSKSPTALIPAAVGLPILLLGLLALKPNIRKHAMHVAAMLGMLGLLAALGRLAMAGLQLTPAGISLLLMVVLCGGFLVLCVKSFVDARIRQRAAAN